MNPTIGKELAREKLRSEALVNKQNGCVGRELALENARVRIWRTVLKPRERIAYHAHQLDFIWLAVSNCSLDISDVEGISKTHSVQAGEVFYRRISHKSEFVRTVRNIGTEIASFTIVEFLNSDNDALPIPEHIRKR